jgi:hypothetical protein
VDAFLALYDPMLLRREDGQCAGAYFVDLGYGAEPVTTLESAERFRRLNPQLPVLGVEIDPARVAAAQPYAGELTRFRLGGFNLPLERQADGTPERVRLIRAFNVLRQYEEADVAGAWSLMARDLLPGGLLVEGTSEPTGRLWVAHLLRKPGAAHGLGNRTPAGPETAPLWQEGLVFSTSFRLGFDPAAFQAVLPKSLIHRVAPGEPIYDFFQAWKQAAAVAAPMRAWGQRQWFVAAAEQLASQGFAVTVQRKFLSRGYLLVRGLPDPCLPLVA